MSKATPSRTVIICPQAIHYSRLRESDRGLIRSTITHPALYPHLSDDFSPAPEDFDPPIQENIWYVAAYDGEDYLGLWMLHPENAICWKIHTALLPNAWGPRAAIAGRGLIEWLWRNTSWHRVVTDVPEYNRLAYRYALRCGFEVFGKNPLSFMKNGQLHTQILLGVSRPQEIPPCR